MPNHIQSQVEIKGSKENIAKLVKKLKLKRDVDANENEFDFNGIIKMPPELLATTSPTIVVDTEEEAKEKNNADAETAAKNNWTNHTDRYLSKAEAERRQEEYGALNWYDWSNANWGTKWNAYDVRYITGDEEKIVVEISTAWDTPHRIWDALDKQGFEVNGVYYGEMEGHGEIGDPWESFNVTLEVDYCG